jgi:uncharacterized protein (TIGR03545 family)
MRWKALIIVIPLLLLFGLGYYFFFDRILETGIESGLEAITGAKVEIDKLHFSITTPSISIQRLQITNPNNTWRNMIETGEMQCKLAWKPLFSGKFVIEKIALREFMLDTPRKTNGKINHPPPKGPYGKTQSKLQKAFANIPLFNSSLLQGEIIQNTEKLLAGYKFQTHVDTEAIKTQISKSSIEWNQDLEKLGQDKLKLQTIDDQLKALKVNQLKTVPELTNALNAVNAINQSVNEIRTDIDTTKIGFQSQLDVVSLEINKLATTARQDYEALLKLAKIPDFKNISFTEILLGKSLVNQTSQIIDLVDKIQAFLPPPTKNPPKKNHPRGGQDIIFPGRRTYPNFLIEYIGISARKNELPQNGGFYAQGTVTGITSDPPIYGAPLRIDLTGNTPGNLYLALRGNMDHITKRIDDKFSLEVANLAIPNLNIGEQAYLPKSISVGSTAIRTNLEITSDEFSLDLVIDGKNMVWSYGVGQPTAASGTTGELLESVVRETLARMNQVTISYRLTGRNQQLAVSISSNLDKLFNERLSQVIDEKFAKLKQDVKAQVDRELQTKQQELESILNNYQQQLATKNQELQTMLTRETKSLEAKAKALEDRIKNELSQKVNNQTDQSKKELEDQLNKLKNQLPKIP